MRFRAPDPTNDRTSPNRSESSKSVTPPLARGVATIAGALIGGVAGYMVGAIAGCDWLMPTSNLCGIYGMLLTGPIGLVVGAILGWRRSGAPRRGR